MKHIIVLLLLLLETTNAVQKTINFQLGVYLIHFTFNNASISTDKVIFTRQSGRDVWFVTTNPSSHYTNIVCRQQSQKRIVWGPFGCSNINDPSLALFSANCIPDEPTRLQELAIHSNTWWLDKTSNECFIEGGDGNVRLCNGPFRLAIQGRDPWQVTDPDSIGFPRLLMQAQMVFVETLTDPLAMMVGIVETPILPPILIVQTNCSVDFSQNYTLYNKDVYPITISDIWQTFKGETTTTSRVIFRAQGEEGNFIVQFATQVGTSLTPRFNSTTFVFTFAGSFPSWFDLLPFNTPIPLYSDTINCTASFSVALQGTLTLAPVAPLTPNDYMCNQYPRGYLQTNICNYAIGRLTCDGVEYYSFLPEGSKRGGVISYQDAKTGLPVGVAPNPNLDYEFDCYNKYPLNQSFLTYGQDNVSGKSRQERMSIASESCYWPFPLPELIALNLNLREPWVQCEKGGGYTFGQGTPQGCSAPITQLRCRKPKENIYFDQNCYHKFNPATDQKYAVPIDKADESCQLWNPASKALVSMDQYLEAWILRTFLYISRSAPAYYRVPEFGNGRCTLFLNGHNVTAGQSCYTTTFNNTYVFPICYYDWSVLPPLYYDQQISLQGAALRVNGQKGPKTGGGEAVCIDFNGWENKGTTKTCPLPIALVGQLTPEEQFFQRCYEDARGECYMTDPSFCMCKPNYAPDAAIITTKELLYQFRFFPCAFPASVQIDTNQFIANGQLYTIPFPQQNAVCGGLNRGSGFVANNSTNKGYCICAKRPNLLTFQLEDAYDGEACSCDRPILPYLGLTKNGPFQTTLCSGRGTCCPFGESAQNPYLGDPTYHLQCPNRYAGCACPPGWGATACQCPIPYNLVANRRTEKTQIQQNVFYSINLGQREKILYINSTWQPYLANQVGQNSSTNCIYNTSLLLWYCPSILQNDTYQFIYWQGSSLNGGVVAAFSEMFNYCGQNNTVNPFAGRFFQIALYRDAFLYLLQQPFTTSSFGCTNTECMCSPLYGGRLCRSGVSSYRLIQNQLNQLIWSKLFCGEETPVPQILSPVAGRGVIDIYTSYCKCNPISSVDPTGRIGRTAETFTSTSCQCTLGQNPDTGEVEMCSGKGVCEEAWFPYGTCESDYETYINDPLSTPFVSAFESGSSDQIFTLSEDAYFFVIISDTTSAPSPVVNTPFPTFNPVTNKPTLSPTKPTRKPTVNPSKNPTLNPTTKKPTTNPTTKKPTLNPTLNPTTKKPTLNPTTKKPTTNPTTNPTTKKPTKNPTKNPTLNPT